MMAAKDIASVDVAARDGRGGDVAAAAAAENGLENVTVLDEAPRTAMGVCCHRRAAEGRVVVSLSARRLAFPLDLADTGLLPLFDFLLSPLAGGRRDHLEH